MREEEGALREILSTRFDKVSAAVSAFDFDEALVLLHAAPHIHPPCPTND